MRPLQSRAARTALSRTRNTGSHGNPSRVPFEPGLTRCKRQLDRWRLQTAQCDRRIAVATIGFPLWRSTRIPCVVEIRSELESIRRVRGALDKDMQMIRHSTPGVRERRMCGSDFTESTQYPSSGDCLREIRAAMIAAEREENAFTSAIFIGRPPDVFSPEFHFVIRFHFVTHGNSHVNPCRSEARRYRCLPVRRSAM